MKIHNIEQWTPEWFAVRQKKLTASKATAIGNAGTGLTSYVYEKLAEHYSSAEVEHTSTVHTDRGNELEPLAREMYQWETDNIVREVGFIEHNEYVWCSPDGLVGDDGGIEIKCPCDTVYFRLLHEQKIKSDYIRQVQMNLYITGRKWWDFVAYNPNFKKSLRIHKITPDPEAFAKLEKGIEKGTKLMQEIDKQYLSLLS